MLEKYFEVFSLLKHTNKQTKKTFQKNITKKDKTLAKIKHSTYLRKPFTKIMMNEAAWICQVYYEEWHTSFSIYKSQDLRTIYIYYISCEIQLSKEILKLENELKQRNTSSN